MPDIDTITDALRVAQTRGILPTSMGTADLRAMGADVLARSVFTARGSSAILMSRLKEIIDQVVTGNLGEGQAETAIWEVLKAIGYTPEGGLPDDVSGEVPPAVRGSLQDLSSFRRIRLIVRTQVDLMTGAGQQMRGHFPENLRDYPAWELVRIEPKVAPRNWDGSQPTKKDPRSRWVIAGGSLVDGRMIALKGDPIWGELGAWENFPDALGVDHPPFAFQSGMGWREVSAAEVARLGITGPAGESPEEWLESRPQTLRGRMELPAPRLSMKDVDPDLVREFSASTGATPAGDGTDMFDFSDILARELAAAGADGKGVLP